MLGTESWMDREAMGVIVAAMSLPHVLDRLIADAAVIAPSDRTDLIPGLMLAHQSGTFPPLAGILLTGGYQLPDSIRRLAEGVQQDLPIALTDLGTFTTAERLMRVRGPITKDSSRKIETAHRAFAEQVDQAALLAAIDVSASDVRTPLMFEYQLMERARADRQRIVLPESEDDRILEAAAILLRRGVADLILLGEETKVRARASALGLDLDEATIVSPLETELVEKFAAAYAEARAHKGMTRGARPGHRHRYLLLRHDDGPSRSCRRHGVGCGEHNRAHHSAGVGVRQDQAWSEHCFERVLDVSGRSGAGLRRLRSHS